MRRARFVMILLFLAVLFSPRLYAANARPVVTITSPEAGAVFDPPATITVEVDASDADGTVERVDFYNGSTLVGSDTSAPWSLTVSGVPSGRYRIRVRAIDNQGKPSRAARATIYVNQPPVCSLRAPADGKVYRDAPAESVLLKAGARDRDNAVGKVEFYLNGESVGSDVEAPYEVTLSDVEAGTYTVGAVAVDERGLSSAPAPARSFRVNAAPEVTVTAPASDSVFGATETVVLSASAYDSDGTIAQVEFFRDGRRIATDTSAPWTYEWTDTVGGTHAITARATDSDGARTVSGPVSIAINKAPTCKIKSPKNNQVFNGAPVDVLIQCNASDADGSVVRVEYYAGSTKIGESTDEPHQLLVSDVPLGTYTVYAVATDDFGDTTTSSAVSVIVNDPPSVNLISPQEDAVFDPPALIPLWARATDSDGSISKVQFLNGGTVIGESTSGFFGYYFMTWSNVPGGRYRLRARAFDNHNARTTSDTVTVYVNRPPVVRVTNPDEGAGYAPDTTIPFTVNVSDKEPGGSVARVEFFIDGTKVGEDTEAPFRYDWPGADSGAYVATAIATDDRGLSASSDPIHFNITEKPVVNILSPANNSAYEPTDPVTLQVEAYDPDGEVVTVQLRDGSTVVDELTEAPYTFALGSLPVGTYNFKARAFDNLGARTTSSRKRVYVTYRPVAEASATPVEGVAPFAVQFTGTGTDEDDDDASLTYRWVFGDGGSSDEQNPSYIYTTPGRYTATLYVSDGKLEGSTTVDVNVQAPVALVARDQNGALIDEAELYCSLTGEWHPSGTIIPMTVGETVEVGSRYYDLDGVLKSFEVRSTSAEFVYVYRTLPVTATDQYGTEVPGVDMWVSAGLYMYYQLPAGGGSITLPEGVDLIVWGMIDGIYTDFVFVTTGDGLSVINLPFWTAMVDARDQDNERVTGAGVTFKDLGGATYGPGTTLTLPERLYLRMRGRRGNVVGQWQQLNWAERETFDPGFRTVEFKAVADDGSTELTDVMIEVQNTGTPPFAPGGAVGLPVDSTVKAVVTHDGQTVGQATTRIDSETMAVTITTSLPAP